jgi:hypothetical protein
MKFEIVLIKIMMYSYYSLIGLYKSSYSEREVNFHYFNLTYFHPTELHKRLSNVFNKLHGTNTLIIHHPV